MGGHGQLIVNLIPEVGIVIGKQPPIRTLHVMTRRRVSGGCCDGSLARLRNRNIRSCFSLTICNGRIQRPLSYWNIS